MTKYRQHQPGTPDVPDVVHPGDWIKSNYNTEGLVVNVIKVKINNLICYTIRFFGRGDLHPGKRFNQSFSWYNEVVYFRGKLRKLFVANGDNFEVCPVPPDVFIPEGARRLVNEFRKPRQLLLFEDNDVFIEGSFYEP